MRGWLDVESCVAVRLDVVHWEEAVHLDAVHYNDKDTSNNTDDTPKFEDDDDSIDSIASLDDEDIGGSHCSIVC